MREIWFKGKTGDGNWVLGFFSRTAYMGKITHVFITERVTGCLYEILPETLCEYTGLNDSQGVPIFENDIIIYGSEEYTVEWIEGGFEPFSYSGWEDFIKPSECTVIGNKWDNYIIQMHMEELKDEDCNT